MKIPLAKLKAILLFFSTYTDGRFLGKVKLMKLFYFLDFTHVKKYGAPITFDSYVNMEHGPIPSNIMNLVYGVDEDIDSSVLSDTIKIVMPEDSSTKMHRITGLREFNENDRKLFSENELETLSKVVERFGKKNTSAIEKASHKEAPWALTKFLEEIPYTLAAQDPDCLVSAEEIEFLVNA